MTENLRKIRFFRRSIPSFSCIPGCHDCCGPVTASSEEMHDLPLVGDTRREASLAELRCPHLGTKGCTVYAERPVICRLFGTTSRLACPHGRRPEQMVDKVLDGQIQQFFLDTRQVLI